MSNIDRIVKDNDTFLALIAAKQANSATFTAKRRVEAANEAVKAGVVFG